MENSVKVENLSIKFGNQTILKNISFNISPQNSICVIGQGSSGKTTLLKCIIGLIKPFKGNIYFDHTHINKHVVNKSEFDIKNLGVVFQKDALFDSLTVWENIMFKGLYDKSKKQNFNESLSLLKMVDLADDVASLYPNELSGGMKKRVAIARAIAFKPNFLFLDEPTAGLDPIKSNKIFRIIKDLSKERGMTVFAISSDIKGAVENFSQIVFLENKKIHWKGQSSKVKLTTNKSLSNFIKKSNLF
mgnify:CR=1 FL=1